MATVISYTVGVMFSKERVCDDIWHGIDVSFNVFQVRYRAGLVIHTVWVTSVFFSSCDSVVGDSLEFNEANRGSLCV